MNLSDAICAIQSVRRPVLTNQKGEINDYLCHGDYVVPNNCLFVHLRNRSKSSGWILI